MLAFQAALVVLCLLPLELPLLFLLGALSEGLVLLLLLRVTPLSTLLLGLATLLFDDSGLLLLSHAPLLLPDANRLSFLSLGYRTLLLEKGFVVETDLLSSAQFFVETDLLLSFPPKCLLFAPLLQEPLFGMQLLLQIPLVSLFESLIIWTLRVSLRPLLSSRLLVLLLSGCSTFGVLDGAITCICLGVLFGFESGGILISISCLFRFNSVIL